MTSEKIFDLKGNPIKGKSDVYNMRLCLVGMDDIDIKNIQTFGIADDGFFMVKRLNNTRPVSNTHLTLPTNTEQ